MLLVLWEGGWEWRRLTKSIYISIEITCPSSFFLLPSSFFLLPSSFFLLSLFLINILFLAGRVDAQTAPVPPLCHFRSENLHSVRSYPQKVEKTSSKNTFPQLCQFSFLKPIISLRAVPKESEKNVKRKRHF